MADPSLNADPFAAYERVRAAGPIVKTKLMSGTASHAAANQVLRSADFGVGSGHGELPPLSRRVLSRIVDPDALGPMDPPSLLAVDPPDHARYRRLGVARVHGAIGGCTRAAHRRGGRVAPRPGGR